MSLRRFCGCESPAARPRGDLRARSRGGSKQLSEKHVEAIIVLKSGEDAETGSH